MRHSAAVAALACLLLVPAIAFASDYDNFNKAFDKGDYAKAAKIAIALENWDYSATALERFGNACELAGRIPEAVAFKAARLYREEFHGQLTSSAVFTEARSIAQLAAQGKVTPTNDVLAAMAAAEAGDTLRAVRELYRRYNPRGYGMEHSLCGDALKAYLFPAFATAMKQGDLGRAAELARCRPLWTPEQYRSDVLKALEHAGDVADAVRQAYDDVFTGQQGYGPYTFVGNPALLPVAAEIAHRHQYTSDIPLVAAYARYLAGDTQAAIAAVERIAGRPDGDVINDTVCVARFVAGDLWRKQGDLRRALSWYHVATWSDFNHWERLYISPATYRDADSPRRADHFHRILGTLRQAAVLLAQGRPRLALDELSTMVDLDSDIREHVNENSTLVAEWRAASDSIKARVEAEPASGRTEDSLDSLGYYANDWVVDAKGRQIPRRTGRTILEQMLAEHEALRQWIANERNSSEFQAFQERMERAQAEAEAAKSATSSPRSGARTQAFQLNPGTRSNVCVRCKGSGSLYVPPNETQGWKYSEVDKQAVDTRIYTSGHMVKCHWCNGTGTR